MQIKNRIAVLEEPTTASGGPDMRLAQARHDPALVVGQALADAVNEVFSDLSGKTVGATEANTGHADMRLAEARHDPKLVAMQQVMDRAEEVRKQIGINKDLASGTKRALPTLEELFESEFLDALDLATQVRERVPDYETVRKAHLKYGDETQQEEISYDQRTEGPASSRHLDVKDPVSPARRKKAG